MGHGWLVVMAVGDSYGAGREFVNPPPPNDLTYLQHPTHTKLLPGCYTDDTQMALGLTELLLSGEPQTHLYLTRYFLKAFARDPRYGYSMGFRELLVHCTSMSEGRQAAYLLAKLAPHSAKCGGAMRAAPCGFLETPAAVRDLAMWQASLTHATYEGMTAAAASALLVWACRRGCDLGYLPMFLREHLPGVPWTTPWQGPTDTGGFNVVRAALTALSESPPSLRAILLQAVEFGGDTDTVAAIALAAAGVHPDIVDDLPAHLYRDLEPGIFGAPFLQSWSTKLEQKFPLAKP